MKQLNLIVSLALTMIVFTACPKADPDKPANPISPEGQKEILEDVAEDFMNQYPSSQFDKLAKLASRFSEVYIDNAYYNWDAFEEYCESKEDDVIIYEEDIRYEGSRTYYDTYTTSLLQLSLLNCKLVLGQNSASCQDYNGTQVEFSLDGKDYVVKLVTSGKTMTVVQEWEEEDSYYNTIYNDSYHVEVQIPENLSVTITENGKNFAEMKVSCDASFSSNGVNLSKDCLIISTSVAVDGHEVVLERTGYNATTGQASLSFKLRKGGKELFRAEASATAKLKFVTEKDNYGNEYTYVDVESAKSIGFYVNVLGRVQVQGSCSNITSLNELIEAFYDVSNDSAAERTVKNINNLIDLAVYYDEKPGKQAVLIMDYYIEEGYYDSYYELEPILEFADGSKYAVYEYFTESSFKGLSNSAEDWLEDYENLLMKYFD